MKKFVITILMTIALLFAVNQNTEAQVSLGVNAGYSWLSGVVGGELEVGHWGFGMGYMPTSMPLYGEPITSISWFIMYQDAVFQESSGYYVTMGSTSNGYRYQDSGGGQITSPMWIAMLGYKYNWYSGLNAKLGCGVGWCEYATVFTWEVTLGYKFELKN